MRGTQNIPSVYVCLRRDDKLLFVLRNNTGYKDGTYALPSGHVEAGESFRAAAAREALEEVGVRIQPTHFRHIYTLHRNEGPGNIWVDVFFEADKWEGEPVNNEPAKHSEIAWLPVDDLAKHPIMDYQAQVLDRIVTGERYNEVGWEKQAPLAI